MFTAVNYDGMDNAKTGIGLCEMRLRIGFALKREIQNVIAAVKAGILLHYFGHNYYNYFHEFSIYTTCRLQPLRT